MKYIQNVVIFYNNIDDMIAYLNEIQKQKLSNGKIVITIVMNKYTENEEIKLGYEIQKYNYLIELVYPEKNLGYLNGLLFGYRNSKFKHFNFEWIAFSNTDIVIAQEDFFWKFLENQYEEEILCVGPSVYVPKLKVYSNPQYKHRYSKKELERKIKIFRSTKLSRIYFELANLKAFFKRSKKESSGFVYSAHGSFFFLKNVFLNNLNKDYMSILYSEEAFIAEEVRIMQGKIYYDSTIEVEHHENKVTGKLGKNKQAKYIADSLEKIVKEYF